MIGGVIKAADGVFMEEEKQPYRKNIVLLKKLKELLENKGVTEEELHATIEQIKNPPQQTNNNTKHHWGTRRVRFGLISDTHIGSKHADYKALNDIMKRFKKEGVDAIYHAGDITEGYNRRKGHSLECDLHGADAQAAGVAERFPDTGKPTYFITGDHDGWHWESAGVDIGRLISKERNDMHYLGPYNATIELSPGTTMELTHPSKGTAYAISYHIQKLIESMSGGDKPNILAVGHYHKAEQLFYRNVHALQAGTLQHQTPWMRRMNISAHKGGWLVDVRMKDDGTIDKLVTTLFPYY